MIKKIIIVACCFFLPLMVQAQSGENNKFKDEVFEARVIKVIAEKRITRENGSEKLQQDLLLKGLSGEWKNKEITYHGISELLVEGSAVYKVGDKVMVQNSPTAEGDNFFIIDYVRRGYLYLLAALFAVTILIIGRKKGWRSLLGLIISFVIIIKILLPLIMAGYNPLIVGLICAFFILSIIILLTEGWNRKSVLALVSVFCSLLITLILSVIFTNLTRLTGLAQEETVFLINLGNVILDFKGLLLAGIMIGAVGVLDDVIVGQIGAVEQIVQANPDLPASKLFSMAYQVGNTHLGAIVNTLFLTYAGASLPLLLLFGINQPPFMTFGQVINNEIIATEIVRTLIGSIGVAMSLPVSTYFAAYFLKGKN